MEHGIWIFCGGLEGGAPAPHPLVGMRFPLSNYYVPQALSRFTDDVMACHGN